jgi:hypothetical protein
MNLTTTLEMSKRLKEAGWMKKTEFYHANIFQQWEIIHKSNHFMEYGCKRIPTPTITELLEELNNDTIAEYSELKNFDWDETVDLFCSPDKLADCWIWAKKEGLIK